MKKICDERTSSDLKKEDIPLTIIFPIAHCVADART